MYIYPIMTKVLFISDGNGYDYLDPRVNLVEFDKDVSFEDLDTSEKSQLGASRMGGNWLKITQDLHLDYKVLFTGKLSQCTDESSYDFKYKLISGNY